jgi:hypothetical protein
VAALPFIAFQPPARSEAARGGGPAARWKPWWWRTAALGRPLGYVKEVLGDLVLTDEGLQRIAMDK